MNMLNNVPRSTQRNVRWAILVSSGVLFLVANTHSVAQERGRFDAQAYLRGLDANHNDKIDLSEMSGRTEGFLKGMGLDTSQPLPLSTIMEKINRDRGDLAAKEKSSSKSSKSSSLKVPGFGATNDPVPTFGPAATEKFGSVFSDSVNKQVDETLRQYDRNKNGVLESDELSRARWGQPRPEESDTNGDGKLSRIELSNRYRAREMYKSQNETSDNRSRTSRDEDRSSRSSSRDRGSFGASSNRTPASSSFRSSSSPSSSSTSSSSSGSNDDRYTSYADSLIKQYDKDGDGKLSKEEAGAMRRPPRNADPDNDGFITKDELIGSLSGTSSSSAAPTAAIEKGATKSTSNFRSSGSSTSTRSSGGSFGDLDANHNNQVEMHEFSKEWDDEKLAQFYEKDKNRDGVITAKEWSGR